MFVKCWKNGNCKLVFLKAWIVITCFMDKRVLKIVGQCIKLKGYYVFIYKTFLSTSCFKNIPIHPHRGQVAVHSTCRTSCSTLYILIL